MDARNFGGEACLAGIVERARLCRDRVERHSLELRVFEIEKEIDHGLRFGRSGPPAGAMNTSRFGNFSKRVLIVRELAQHDHRAAPRVQYSGRSGEPVVRA